MYNLLLSNSIPDLPEIPQGSYVIHFDNALQAFGDMIEVVGNVPIIMSGFITLMPGWLLAGMGLSVMLMFFRMLYKTLVE